MYVICGRNLKCGVWIHFEVVECCILLLGHLTLASGLGLEKSRKRYVNCCQITFHKCLAFVL